MSYACVQEEHNLSPSPSPAAFHDHGPGANAYTSAAQALSQTLGLLGSPGGAH